jgi:hypothetical protein
MSAFKASRTKLTAFKFSGRLYDTFLNRLDAVTHLHNLFLKHRFQCCPPGHTWVTKLLTSLEMRSSCFTRAYVIYLRSKLPRWDGHSPSGKFTVPQPVTNSLSFMEPEGSTTAFSLARHWKLPTASSVQSIASHSIPLRSV